MVQSRLLKVFGELFGYGARAVREGADEISVGPLKVAQPDSTAGLESLVQAPLERIVWVSHGGVIRTIRTWLRGKPLEESLRYTVNYFGTVVLQRDSDGLWTEVRTEHQLIDAG